VWDWMKIDEAFAALGEEREDGWPANFWDEVT
jgi:hypothetical protein